jgi:hypothetical protein
MAELDIQRLQRQVRRRYEIQRGLWALVGSIPVVAVVVLACCNSQRVTTSAAFGGGALLVGVAMLWLGQEAQRAVLPALIAGAIPLTLALWANQAHGCCVVGGTCPADMPSMCLTACSAGGVIAGLLMAAVGHRWRAGLWFWLSATAVAALVGAMGCACVGYTGIFGLVGGYSIGVLPGILSWLRRRQR